MAAQTFKLKIAIQAESAEDAEMKFEVLNSLLQNFTDDSFREVHAKINQNPQFFAGLQQYLKLL